MFCLYICGALRDIGEPMTSGGTQMLPMIMLTLATMMNIQQKHNAN